MNAVVAQSVEHILGKDEVGSSNLLNSSKNPETKVSGFFFAQKQSGFPLFSTQSA